MSQQQYRRAWIISPCRQDPDFGDSALEFRLAEVVRCSTDEVEVVLRDQPPIGRLLTLEMNNDLSPGSAIVAKVTAAKSRPEGGWLVHCKPVLPLTKSLLQMRPVHSV